MRGELELKDNQLIGITSELERLREDQHSLKGEVEDRGSAIVTLQTELEKIRGEVEERDDAIATLKAELEARGDKQLNLFPGQKTTPEPEPEPEPEPTPEPEPVTEPEPTPTQTPEQKTKTKTKAKSKAKSNPAPEIDLASLIIPPGYKLGDSAELIEFVIENFPNSELKNKGDITDAIRDRHGKAKGSENSRLFNFEQECGFKHLGKVGAKHKFLIPIG